MSWASLGLTQWVSFNDMTESGIPLNGGQSHTYTAQWITKDELITKYNVNTSYLTGLASNQWVERSLIVTASPVDPPTSTLTIEFYSNTWYATLTNPIPSTNIEIYNHGVLGYTTSDCSGGAEEGGQSLTLTIYQKFSGVVDVVLPLGIAAGDSSGNQVVGGMTCASIRYKLNSNAYFINGVSRNNGAVFTVGGTTVTLVVTPTSCTAYPC